LLVVVFFVFAVVFLAGPVIWIFSSKLTLVALVFRAVLLYRTMVVADVVVVVLEESWATWYDPEVLDCLAEPEEMDLQTGPHCLVEMLVEPEVMVETGKSPCRRREELVSTE
jgi:hypothetical protein